MKINAVPKKCIKILQNLNKIYFLYKITRLILQFLLF